MLVSLFVHSFTVYLKSQFAVSNRYKVFISFNTLHCLTLYNSDFLCLGEFSEVSMNVICFRNVHPEEGLVTPFNKVLND